MVLREGEVLGGYMIGRLLGRGGMGAVYLANDVRLGRNVAIKVLAQDTAEIPKVRERFVRESKIAASLDHPHILPIYEAGEAGGQLFIAMRYVPGSDLEGIIQRDGPLSLERTVALIDQVASALDAAHGAGLIHRDVKPGNILVATGSQPGTDHTYLSDFGLTKHAEYSGGQLTRSGQLIGSVGYVAPEQIESKPIDARADVYSLGCVLFECLAGAQPYPRDSEIATLYAHVQAPPPSLALARPELPPTIDAVIAKAMAKAPDERYSTAGELAKGLTEAARPDAAARHLTRGFLFSDLRGYTAFVEGHGDTAAAHLLETYRRLVRDVVRRYGGAEIKTEGDSFYVVFPSASDAVRCGLAIVAAARTATTKDQVQIDVGIGVHAGETAETEEGYVGSAVNIAARVCAQAAAGEVLVTDTVRGLTRTSGEVAFVSRGRKHLKGIAELVSVFAATAAMTGGTPTPRAAASLAGFVHLSKRRRIPLLVAGGGGLVALLLAVLALTSGLGGRPSSSPTAGSGAAAAAAAGESHVPTSTRIAWYQEFVDDLHGELACVPATYGQVESHLWLMDPMGGSPVRLLPNSNVWETSPAWSPDGTHLAFVASEQNSGNTVWMAASDGTDARRVPTDGPLGEYVAAQYARPAWSPDGKLIAFLGATTATETGVMTGSTSVATVKTDGSGKSIVRADAGSETKATPTPGASMPVSQLFDAPAWTPDGELGLVVHDNGPPGVLGRVALVKQDGTGYHELSLALDALDVAWSPDGSKIAVSSKDSQSRVNIWVATPNTAGLQKVSDGPHDMHPSWSPDGRQIVFASDRDGHFEIYRMDRDGTNVTRLTTTPATLANCEPAWGPAGPTPSPAPSPAVGAALTFHRGRLAAGTYRDDTFQPPIGFTFGPGWESRRTYIDGLALGRTGIGASEIDVAKLQVVIEGGCFNSGGKTRVVATPPDVLRWLQSNANLRTGNPNPINLGGYSGISVDVTVVKAPACTDGPTGRVYLFNVGEDVVWLRPGDEVRLLALDVRGALVVLMAGGPTADNFIPLAQPVLSSLQFPDP